LSPTLPEVDPVLVPFLQAPDDDTARLRLGELLDGEARPVAADVIRGHLRGTSSAEQEDVLGGVLLSLAAHLRGVRQDPLEREPIRSFGGYVAATAHHACHAFHRARFPLRAQLRSRTRYVLTRDPALALWDAGSREWLCGTAARRGTARHPATSALLAEQGGRRAAFPTFPALVHALLDALPGPARFEDLVDALAAIQGISDQPPRGVLAADETTGGARDEPDRSPSPEAATTDRDFLRNLWTEIRLLPARQRAALLLNLRDAEGLGIIELFPATGTAAIADLAAALEMTEEALGALWDELPRDDAWIAARMGLTRRQVINLRKCARERLARRMRREGW
jgi:hypothetical protein